MSWNPITFAEGELLCESRDDFIEFGCHGAGDEGERAIRKVYVKTSQLKREMNTAFLLFESHFSVCLVRKRRVA